MIFSVHPPSSSPSPVLISMHPIPATLLWTNKINVIFSICFLDNRAVFESRFMSNEHCILNSFSQPSTALYNCLTSKTKPFQCTGSCHHHTYSELYPVESQCLKPCHQAPTVPKFSCFCCQCHNEKP